MRSSKERLVNELNRTNNQTLAVTDIGFANPGSNGVGLQTRLTAVALSTGTIASAGQANVTYNRMDLETVFNMVGRTLSVMVGDSIQAILPSLRRYTGLVIDAVDVLDTAINWVDGQASVEITASPRSLSWVGSTSLTLSLTPMQLSSVFRNPVVDMTSESVITLDKLYRTEMRQNGVYVPYDVLTFSAPRTVARSGYNTEITVTAKANTGYVGSAVFAYNRYDIGDVFGDTFAVRDEVTSAWFLIKYLVAEKGDIITPDDLLDTTFDFSQDPAPNTLTANPESLTYAGTSDIYLKRRGANTQTITLNFTQDDLALSPTAIKDGVLAQDNGKAFADVIINVARNVTLVGASSTTPTFNLDNFGGISQTDYYINNLGSIYGRGGDGGSATTPVGQNGGDALYNAVSDNRVFIDNQGRIAGGGGGGGVQRATSAPGLGGGGAPFGKGAANAVATLTNYTLATSNNNGTATATGGNGGAVGVKGTTPTSTSLDYTTGGAVGAVVGGAAESVSWINTGIQVPFPAGQVRPTYVTQPINVYLDPADATKIVAHFGTTTSTQTELRAPYVADALGMTEGTVGTDTSTQTAHVAYIDGKFLLIPYLLMRSAISWNTLYALGLVGGKGRYGDALPVYSAPVIQGQPWRVGSDRYVMRLMQGLNTDSVTTLTTNTTATAQTANSEWDRLMSLLVTDSVTPAQPGSKWAGYTVSNWGLVSGVGSAVWARERVDMSSGTRRVYRGISSGLGVNSLPPETRTSSMGWRPVLEWQSPVDTSEYDRFVAWLATNPTDVPLQLNGATDISTSPYFTNSAQAAKGGIYDRLVSYYGGGGLNVMYGSPYGTYFGDGASWGSVFAHCMPSRIAHNDLVFNKRVVLAYIKSNPKQSFVAVTRNLYTSTAGTTSNTSQYALQITKFVYFDSTLGKMMQCNPSTQSAPTEFLFWVGDRTALTTLITTRGLGVLPATTHDDNFLDVVADLNGLVQFADNEVVFSNPTEYTGSEGNTKVTISAQPGGRYTGSVDVYFTRQAEKVGRSVPARFQWPLSADIKCTMYTFLQVYHPGLIDTYFSDLTEADFDQTVLSFGRGLAPQQLKVSIGSKYRGLETTTIDINPVQDNWWGADTLSAWDTSMFKFPSGMVDALGNPMMVRSNIYGVGGNIAKSNQPNPVFSGAVQLYGAGIFTSVNRITPAQLQAAWTVDMWYYNTDDGYAATGLQNRLSLFLLSATADHGAAAVASRLLIASSSNSPGYVTGWLNSLNPTTYGDTYAPALQRKGWSHLAMTYNGSGSYVIYNNGIQVATLSSTTMVITSVPTTWELGVFGYIFSGVPNVEVERWRFRSGIKFSNNFDPNLLYAPNYANPKALSSVVKSQTLSDTPPEGINAIKFLKLVSVTDTPLDPIHLTVSNPVAYTGPEGNTKVTLTAVSGGIYTGAIDIYYNRVSMATGTLPTKLYKFADTVAFNDTMFAYLQKYFPEVLTTNYPGRTAAEFDATKTVIALGYLPVMSVQLIPLDVWRYRPDVPIVINPINNDWVGSDGIVAWDSSQYVQTGFTDKLGNAMKPYNNIVGTAGSYPTVQTIQTNPFGKGLLMPNALISTVAQLDPTVYTQPFTVDMWMYASVSLLTDVYPVAFLFAQPDNSVFTANSRLQLSGHDSTKTGQAVWNNASAARLITTPDTVMRSAGWRHIAVTYDGSVFRYYCDGVLAMTSNAYTTVGGNFQASMFGYTISGVSPIVERYRMRKGVKIQAGYTIKDLYPNT